MVDVPTLLGEPNRSIRQGITASEKAAELSKIIEWLAVEKNKRYKGNLQLHTAIFMLMIIAIWQECTCSESGGNQVL